MTTLNPSPSSMAPDNWLRRAWNFNKILTLAIALHLALIPVTALALVVDPKLITGVPAWIKPLKFAASGAIYAITFLWLLTLVQGRRRWVQAAANVTGIGLIVETTLITTQVVRGTASHFNFATPLDAVIFQTMALFIVLISLMNLLLGIFLLFQRLPDPVTAWGVRLGVFGSFVGMIVAFLMTAGPTPIQLAAAQAGQAMTVMGAHSVGVVDGGPGLPFLGWSTTGGDLRVAHFFGLHAMQVIPFVAFLLTGAWASRRWSVRQRVALVWTAGLGYMGLTVTLTWQALRGQPVIAPDVLTWLVWGGLLALVLVGGGLALLSGGRQGQSAPQQPGTALR
jgi:hypothetical protein